MHENINIYENGLNVGKIWWGVKKENYFAWSFLHIILLVLLLLLVWLGKWSPVL